MYTGDMKLFDLFRKKREVVDEHQWALRHLYHEMEMCEDMGDISGHTGHYIFHGGCLSCVSQTTHGIERCAGCQYLDADWSKPDLSINDREKHDEISYNYNFGSRPRGKKLERPVEPVVEKHFDDNLFNV